MLRILANPEIGSLHSHSIKLIVLILEMFCINSPYGFLEIVGEIINSLHGKQITDVFIDSQNLKEFSNEYGSHF